MTIRISPTVKLFVALLFGFALLSLADLYLTWLLIARGNGSALENNPVAAWWLAAYGWTGLTGFKLGMVALIAGLAIGVALSRQR